MLAYLENLIDKCASENRPNLHNNISIIWIRYSNENPKAGSGIGASWSQNKLFYPASVVKVIYGVATEIWLQKDLILESQELRRALADMLSESSNDATSYIVDILTGTTSGPSISGEKWEAWKIQRQLINQWLKSFNWPELAQVNCCQKTWNDSPYGRDKDFYGKNNKHRNSLTTSGMARIYEALMTESLLSSPRTRNLKTYLYRCMDLEYRKNHPENQVDGFLGAGLPDDANLWSKAGLMSEVRHDAAWWHEPNLNPILLIVFYKGKESSKDDTLLPYIAKEINSLNREMNN